MIQDISSISTVFGNAISEGLTLFNNDVDKSITYSKTLIFLEIFCKTSTKSIKKEYLKQYLYSSIETQTELMIFVPLCLRYFYDETGCRQIIDSTETFSYMDMKGNTIDKFFDSSAEILQMNNLKNFIEEIGVPTQINFLIMDHELLRFEEMNTEENHTKSESFIQSLNAEYDGRFISSLETFGDPSKSPEFREIITQITKEGGIPNSKITTKTFERTIDNRHSQFSQDSTVAKQYRSRGTTRKSREYALGESYFHSTRLSKLYEKGDYPGYLLFVPSVAEFDRLIYELPVSTVTFDLKNTEIYLE